MPTLPALQARSPAARRIDASICTVVVLPLVPVTVSHGAAPSRGRSRQASSTSPQTGMPAAAAAASSGWSGRHPGEVTTRSTGVSGRAATASGPCWSRAPRMSRIRARSDITEPGGRCRRVDDGDLGPALEQGVGGGEPAHAEAGDEHPQPGPVGVAVGEARDPVGGGAAHPAPTTHSA